MTSKLIGITVILAAALFSGIYLAGIHAPGKNVALLAAREMPKAPVQQTAEPLPVQAPTETIPASPEAPNATRAFAAELARNIIAKNPQGPTPSNGSSLINAINPESAVNSAIADAVQNIDPAVFSPQVPLADLTVISDTSVPALTTYFSKLQSLFVGAQQQIGFSTLPTSIEQFASAAPILKKLAADLKKVPVPNVLAELHRQKVELTLTQGNVFAAIGNAHVDPIVSVAALHFMPDMFARAHDLTSAFTEAKNNYGIQ